MTDWRIFLNDTDISDKVASFTVTCDATSYCRQLSVVIADPTVYAGLDFLSVPDAPVIEAYVYVGDETAPDFPDDYTCLGSFFAERATHLDTPNDSITSELWGRSKTALLGSPFAAKVTKSWTEDTSFYAICEEMCALCGVTWDPDYSTLPDFFIFAGTYEAENLYPIDVITELARFAAGDSVYITTDGQDRLRIIAAEYAPEVGASAFTVGDDNLMQLSESVEWPDFGNRIKISAVGSTAGWRVILSIPEPCLNATGSARTRLYAQVLDQDGEPQNDIPVDWSLSRSLVSLDAATTNTQTLTISNEAQRAKSYYEVDVTFPPTSVIGVWTARDTRRENNLVASGYELDGNTIILSAQLTYCDQSLIITYEAAGMAINWATAGTSPGTEKVTADVGGNSDTQELYIDNPCACPPDLTLRASPSSIKVGETSLIIAYLEIAGAPVTEGRKIWMTIDSTPARGAIGWTENNLGKVGVSNERTAAINEIAGATQCELEMFPDSVSSIYQSDTEGNALGGNLYDSHTGKVVTLNTALPTGTDLLANYTTIGAIVNDYEGIEVGEDRVRALISTTREERTEATCRIRVNDDSNSDGAPADCCDDGREDSDRDSSPSDNDNKYDWLPETKPTPHVVHCLGADGKVITCQPGQVCCQKNGVWGCYAWNECDQVPDTCYPVNCRENPSPDCLGSRFTTALADNAAFGCSCEELCSKEFDAYGTTQNYDGASMRMVADIVVEDYGHALGTPEFWEKFEELKTEALTSCREQCGDCATAEPITIEGDDAVVQPGAVTFTASGGMGAVSWSVAGTESQGGASIGQDGTLELGESACGSYTITATDICGNAATKTVRVSNGGKWVLLPYPAGQSAWCKRIGPGGVGWCSWSCNYGTCSYYTEYSGNHRFDLRFSLGEYCAYSYDEGFPPTYVPVPGNQFGICTSWVNRTWTYPTYYVQEWSIITIQAVYEWIC